MSVTSAFSLTDTAFQQRLADIHHSRHLQRSDSSKFCRVCVELTWTERVAGDLLHRHALAEGPAVERRRVGAGSRPLLDAPPTRHVAGRPLRPQGPAAVHCGGVSTS